MNNDYFALKPDELNSYFNKLDRIFSVLKLLYDSLSNNKELKESLVVTQILERLSFSKKTLFLKHIHEQTAPDIDATDSGFVDSFLLESLLGEASIAEEKLTKIGSEVFLLNQLSDTLFKGESDNDQLIRNIAQYYYLNNLLDLDKHMFGFVFGDLIDITSVDDQINKYSLWWSCFDRTENRPFIYFMELESSVQLEIDSEEYLQLKKVIEFEGRSSKNLSNIGIHIDSGLDNIHPKLIKRVGFTIYSKKFSQDLPVQFEELFEFGDEGEQFCLLVENEILISDRQVIEEKLFSSDQLREVFYIPKNLTEQSKRGVSHLEKWLIMPYKLHQHAVDIIPNDYKIYSIDSQEVIHGST